MDFTKLLPNIGAPVSSPAFDATAIPAMSVGETAYAAAVFLSALAQRMANPATLGEFAQFSMAPGADWSGFHPHHAPAHPAADNEHADTAPTIDESFTEGQPPRQPVAPENFYDSVPGIAHMVRQLQSAADATLTHFAAHVDAALGDQQTYLGTPEGVKGFNDSSQYFREVLRFSRATTKKIHERIPYVTWTPGKDPSI